MNGNWEDDTHEPLDFSGDALNPAIGARSVMITNLPADAEEEDLVELLQEAGSIADIEKVLMKQPNPNETVTAFVTFAQSESVQSALSLSGISFIDNVITITVHEESQPPANPAPSNPGIQRGGPRGPAGNGGPVMRGRGRGGVPSMRGRASGSLRSLRPPPITNNGGQEAQRPVQGGFGGTRPQRPQPAPINRGMRTRPPVSNGAGAANAANFTREAPVPLKSKYDSRGGAKVVVNRSAIRQVDADGFEHATTIRQMKKERRNKERRENRRRPMRGGFMDRVPDEEDPNMAGGFESRDPQMSSLQQSGFDRWNRGNSGVGSGSRGRRTPQQGNRIVKKQPSQQAAKKKTNLVNRFDALLLDDE